MFIDITIGCVIRVRHFDNKGSGVKTVITSEVKDAINKLVEKDDSVSLKKN